MDKKISWAEIEKLYDQEWIELVDYDWDLALPYPSAGVVRVHSPDRAEFKKFALTNPPEDSAFLFVGEPLSEEGVVYNLNLGRVE